MNRKIVKQKAVVSVIWRKRNYHNFHSSEGIFSRPNQAMSRFLLSKRSRLGFTANRIFYSKLFSHLRKLKFRYQCHFWQIWMHWVAHVMELFTSCRYVCQYIPKAPVFMRYKILSRYQCISILTQTRRRARVSENEEERWKDRVHSLMFLRKET